MKDCAWWVTAKPVGMDFLSSGQAESLQTNHNLRGLAMSKGKGFLYLILLVG
jgi:hypothetical protein